MGKIKITCEEATTICTKAQYGEAKLIDKLKLNLHFMYCKVCRLFSIQNTELSDICTLAKKHKEKEEQSVLTKEDKDRFKEQIQGIQKETP